MAALLPSTTRGRYAVAAVLLLLAAAAGVVTMQRWNGDGSGLFGSGSSQDDIAVIADGSAGMTGITAVDNVLGALLGRSPGERTVSISGKGKGKGPARAYRYARSPAAQALQDAFNTPLGASRVIEDRPTPSEVPGSAVTPRLFLPADALAGAPLVGPGQPGGFAGGPGGGFFGPPGGFSVGGGGGGNGGGNPTNPTNPTGPTNPTDPTNPSNPVPAVPEPGTWLMMLFGMAAIGAALRSGNAKRPAVLSSTI